jgi:hypothetical protein
LLAASGDKKSTICDINEEDAGAAAGSEAVSAFAGAGVASTSSGWFPSLLDWARLGPKGLFHMATITKASAQDATITSINRIRVIFLFFIVQFTIENFKLMVLHKLDKSRLKIFRLSK